MKKTKFAEIRKSLGKTQKQMAELLGVSLKAIHSYEQGWRTIPAYIERQLYFLIHQKNGPNGKTCWQIKKCPDTQKETCPAWEFNCGDLCWFINGTICNGIAHATWKEKMQFCKICQVFKT